MASLEQRINHLFPSRKSKRTSPIAMVAIFFAERRESWLTQDDVIKLMNKKFSSSTTRKAFKELSRPLDVLGGYSFIDTESIKTNGKGRPIIRGRLSEAASGKIFELVPAVKEKPQSYFRSINQVGKIEMPPFLVKKEHDSSAWLPPNDILELREKKIGKLQTNRLLRSLANKGKPHAESIDILKNHHFGPLPSRQIRIMDAGQRDLATDENRMCHGMTALLASETEEDRRRLEAAGMTHCPSCGDPIDKSALLHIQGYEKDICLTEYFESAKKCIHRVMHEDGSWSETIVGIFGMTSEGKTRDECRRRLMNMMREWIMDRQRKGLSIPPMPQPSAPPYQVSRIK
jgi:predicted RNase H-like HicB family nuclease